MISTRVYLTCSLMLIWNLTVISEEDKLISNILNDPRPGNGVLFKSIEKGQSIEKTSMINNALLIICWGNNPNKIEYQISGIDGLHDLNKTVSFLDNFYQRSKLSQKPNLIIAYNQWGVNTEINEKLKPISKLYKFDIFTAGGFSFTEVNLIEEPKVKLDLIKKAWEAIDANQIVFQNLSQDTSGKNSHPLVCGHQKDYPEGKGFLYIDKKNNELIHLVFPEKNNYPQNSNKNISVTCYSQSIKNKDQYPIKLVPNDYKYFVVTTWSYE